MIVISRVGRGLQGFDQRMKLVWFILFHVGQVWSVLGFKAEEWWCRFLLEVDPFQYLHLNLSLLSIIVMTMFTQYMMSLVQFSIFCEFERCDVYFIRLFVLLLVVIKCWSIKSMNVSSARESKKKKDAKHVYLLHMENRKNYKMEND